MGVVMWVLSLMSLFSVLSESPPAKAWRAVPAEVRMAVEHVESRGEWSAVSPAGCIGLMQICPRWSAVPGPLLFVPQINRVAGAKALHYWLKRAGGRWPRALAAYNCGNRGLQGRCGRGYARTVLRHAQELKAMDSRQRVIEGLRQAARESCDHEHVELLEHAVLLIEGEKCLRCRCRKPEVLGRCRPCYQSERRAEAR